MLVVGILMVSCSDSSSEDDKVTRKTVFVYFPWTGNLTSFLKDNILYMEDAIEERGLSGERVVVFFATSSTKADLFEIVCKNGECSRVPLQEYDKASLIEASDITSVLNDVKRYAPALRYSMIVGCHGKGWIPAEDVEFVRTLSGQPEYWEREVPLTRFFGGTSYDSQTDVTALARGIENAGIKMEYILFDVCYMSCIEVAYELRHATDFLIASSCEMMNRGVPYEMVGGYLLGETNYKAVCDGFYSFYSNFSYPYGTLAVTDCSQLDEMAGLMREINARYMFDSKQLSSLQALDGYLPAIFFDYGDYVRKLCKDETLLDTFEQQLNKTVIYKVNTERYYTDLSIPSTREIHTFSGLTVSDPSFHLDAAMKTETSWYKATH